EIVMQFRTHLRLNPLPETGNNFPLIPSWRSSQGLTARHINYLLKELALKTVETHFSEHPAKQAKLKKFSAHWLRHLSATLQDRAGVHFSHIRANLRHEKEDTTRLYVHLDDKKRFEEMNKISEFF
ncbi:MAG: hypothetical protein K2Q14_06850, partial [Gammaproteobacteria bacterium]|nr:hypothetical protein [Gammaproteobacteria bacterium]